MTACLILVNIYLILGLFLNLHICYLTYLYINLHNLESSTLKGARSHYFR